MTEPESPGMNGAQQSPFSLPPTARGYPLDPEEREEIERFLAELRAERDRAGSRPGDAPEAG